MIYSGSQADGFDKLHYKSNNENYLHLFTDKFNVEQPPFTTQNDFVYLSFIIKVKNNGDDYSLHISGGESNNSLEMIHIKDIITP